MWTSERGVCLSLFSSHANSSMTSLKRGQDFAPMVLVAADGCRPGPIKPDLIRTEWKPDEKNGREQRFDHSLPSHHFFKALCTRENIIWHRVLSESGAPACVRSAAGSARRSEDWGLRWDGAHSSIESKRKMIAWCRSGFHLESFTHEERIPLLNVVCLQIRGKRRRRHQIVSDEKPWLKWKVVPFHNQSETKLASSFCATFLVSFG